jgi:hypothetical protein
MGPLIGSESKGAATSLGPRRELLALQSLRDPIGLKAILEQEAIMADLWHDVATEIGPSERLAAT